MSGPAPNMRTPSETMAIELSALATRTGNVEQHARTIEERLDSLENEVAKSSTNVDRLVTAVERQTEVIEAMTAADRDAQKNRAEILKIVVERVTDPKVLMMLLALMGMAVAGMWSLDVQWGDLRVGGGAKSAEPSNADAVSESTP